jgi:hypothetical protein
LQWVVDGHLEDQAIPRLNARGVKSTARLDVPKENFAMRPAVVLDPLDRLIYQALVDRLSVALIGQLPIWVYGWRLPTDHPVSGDYEQNSSQWESFRDHLGRLANYDFAALSTDVVSYFSSIPIDPLSELVLAADPNVPGQRLVGMLRGWHRSTGHGLPQRSAASAVLAHAYLTPLDDIIATLNRIPLGGAAVVPEGRALRWMDDIWLFGRRLSSLRESQIALQSGMRDLGLEMNIGKTRVLHGDEMLETVFEFEHSAIDDALSDDQPDPRPLDDLIDSILAAPETADRTSIRFMTTRMRAHRLFARVGEIADEAVRMPQGGDHLARLFRDSGHWTERQEWYVTVARRWRQPLPWLVGQLGTMFPSGARVNDGVTDLFADIISTGNASIALLSVAAQRLAAWAPDDGRVILRDAASREGHPLSCRSLALAALHAGETTQVVRRLLSQHEENAVILAMLEDARFRRARIPVNPDFAG